MRNQQLGGRYRILDKIGEGGMAYVYLAKDEKLGRKVAIKVLHEHMERNPEIRKRFQLEAQAVSGLEHPNIVKIYDFSGSKSERLWIVTEVIRGKNLAQLSQQFTGGWLHPIVAACVVREICKALEKAHSQGIIHRDIKPENIMITHDGRVKLMDFGIAKDLGKSGMTQTGTFMGSPSYMSPEQIRGRGVDLRSDLYSLSVLFYEVVTGRLPFTGNTTHDVVLKIMEGAFTYPRFLIPNIPEAIDVMIVKGMSKQPSERFQSARDYAKAIDLFLRFAGLDDSHVELERYFKDRKSYEIRLHQTEVSLQKFSHTPPSNHENPNLGLAATKNRSPHRVQTKSQTKHLPPPPRRTHRQPTGYLPRRRQDTKRPGEGSGTAYDRPRRSGRTSRKQGRDGYTKSTQYGRGGTPLPPGTLLGDPGVRLPANVSGDNHDAGQLPERRIYRVPRRSGRRRYRRRTTVPPLQSSWVSYLFGAVLVGLIGAVTIWGFWELQSRLSKTQTEVKHLPSGSTRVEPKTQNTRSVKTTEARKKINLPRESVGPAKKPETQRGRESIRRPRPPRPKVVDRPTSKQKQSPVPPRASPRSEPKPQEPQKVAVAETSSQRDTAPVQTGTLQAEPTESKDLRKPVRRPKPSGWGKVRLSSQPAAEVYIDGRRYGTTIDATTSTGWLSLKSGNHTVELRRQGYQSHEMQINISPGDHRTWPLVVLEQDEAGVRSTALTVRATPLPVQVTIRNLDDNSTQAFTMHEPSRVIELVRGRYFVRVERSGVAKERELVLTGTEGQLTFSAEFNEKN